MLSSPKFKWQSVTLSSLFVGYAGYFVCRANLAVAVRFLADHHRRFPFSELVDSSTFPMNDVENAFRYAEAERPIRVMVRFPPLAC